MNKQNAHPKIKPFFYCLIISAVLSACSDSSDKKKAAPQAPKVSGEVYLTPDSPKKAYLKTTTLSLSEHPLLEPLAGKIIYNETTTSRISSPVTGRVITVPVALGTEVNDGSILTELNSPDVADAEADFDKAQADVDLANRVFNRQKALYAGKAVARKELEQAQDELARARSEAQRAEDRLKNLHINPGQFDGRYALRSTVSGVVVERNVNPGMEVRPDLDKPLFVVSDIKKLTVLMEVFEVNLSKITPGKRLSISVPAYPGEIFPATVKYIGQVLDENTRTVQVRGDLPNADERLLPGMYATINVESDPEELAIVIPLTAIFTEGESDYVFVALDENHFQRRPVKIGLRLKDRAVISSGLQPDEKLVTEGALMLRAEEEVETDSDKP